MGRPKFKTPADERILLYVTAEQRSHVKRVAVAENKSMSEVLRELIDEARDYTLMRK